MRQESLKELLSTINIKKIGKSKAKQYCEKSWEKCMSRNKENVLNAKKLCFLIEFTFELNKKTVFLFVTKNIKS